VSVLFLPFPINPDTATSAQRRVALNLYWEGLDVRAIGRLLGFSHVAVYQWIKVFGQATAQIKRLSAHIVEMDDCIAMWGIKKLLLGLACC